MASEEEALQPSSFSTTHILSSSSHKRRAGRKKFRETRHPVFRGVRQRRGGKWVCEVREPQKKSRIWLGTFPSPEMAARAHDVAALALRGSSAPLNFPDSSWSLPRPVSSSVRDIQAAAAQAARESSGSALPSPPATIEFVDEEAEFNMPTLLTSMAEGLLLAPPRIGFDDLEDHGNLDFSLWTYLC